VKRRLFLSSLVLVGLALVAPHLGGPRLGSPLLSGPRLGDAATQLAPARIVVRADRPLAPVSPLLFGQNHGPWMNTTAGYVADYREAGVTLLRFPGGNWGDENDLFPNNIDDLAMLADALDAQVSVQARSWREGTPEKAAELVRYSNVEHDYDFRYWEVGNEPDLYVNRRNRSGDPVFDADWYNARFREFATAMKAVDPDIQIVGPVVTGGWREWMPAFLAANGDVVDVISWHWYAHGDQMSDSEALATPAQIEEQVVAIREWWRDPAVNPLGHRRPVPPLFLSEYNVSWASSVRRHLGTQVGALWNAEVMGRLADLGVEMAAHFALQGTSWQGLIGMLQDPRPAYGVYKLYAHWGTTQVDAESSDEALLPAFASLHDDGQLAILVVNKDPLEAREATLTVEGFRPAGQARVWLQDEEHLAEELPAIAVAETFPHTFPPYSVTLLILEPVPQGRWLLWAGLGLLAFALVTLGVLGYRVRRSR
jgi:hypothetical protein